MNSNRLLMLASSLVLLAACEVNHMPYYAASIMSAQMEATVTGDIEVEVLEPSIVALDGSTVPVVDPTQDILIDRFVGRVGSRIVESELGVTSVAVFQHEAAARLGWNVDPHLVRHDARFVIDVNDLEITIDDWGHPSLQVNLKVEGWFNQDGELIYREYTDHSVPLLYPDELVEPWDPGNIEDVLGARSINLLMLDDMPDGELRARVYIAMEEAAATAAAELHHATTR